jgi:hypothetical protein
VPNLFNFLRLSSPITLLFSASSVYFFGMGTNTPAFFIKDSIEAIVVLFFLASSATNPL